MIIKSIVGHKVAAVAGALVLGTSAAAAASGGVPFVQDEPDVEVAEVVEEVEEVEEKTETTTTTTTTTAAVEEANEPEGELAANEDDELYDPELCAEADDAERHGLYVSGVAHAVSDSDDGNKGQIVSDAAKTQCGKPDHETDDIESDDDEARHSDDDDDDAHDSDDDDHDDDDHDDDDHDDDKPGNGHGRDRGKGNKNDD